MNAKATVRPRHLVELGLLWGVTVITMETLVLPAGDAIDWSGMTWALPEWCVVGVVLAFLVEIAGDRVESVAGIVIAILLVAVLSSALWNVLYDAIASWYPDGEWASARHADPFGTFVYQAWATAFYGGSYFVASKIYKRSRRSRTILERAEVARLETEVMLGAAQLEMLRGQVEPGLLIRAVAEARRRYAAGRQSADALLGQLAAFLRLAVPAARASESSLDAELRLAGAYEELCAQLESRSPRWIVASEIPGRIPFPPLLILPILDAAAARMRGTGRLNVAIADRGVRLQLIGGPLGEGWLPQELAYRTRVGLSVLYRDRWSLSMGAGDAALEIDLPRETA